MKNKIIEQGFNYADPTIRDMSDFFETRLGEKKSSTTAKKIKEKKTHKKQKKWTLTTMR